MRRYGYFLPALLEDDNLPYCEELCNLVICSEVFHDQSYPPLSEMTRCDIVFYSEDGKKTPNSNGEKIDRDCRQDSFRRTAYKLLVASALVGAVALVVTKHRRR